MSRKVLSLFSLLITGVLTACNDVPYGLYVEYNISGFTQAEYTEFLAEIEKFYVENGATCRDDLNGGLRTDIALYCSGPYEYKTSRGGSSGASLFVYSDLLQDGGLPEIILLRFEAHIPFFMSGSKPNGSHIRAMEVAGQLLTPDRVEEVSYNARKHKEIFVDDWQSYIK